MGCTCNFIKCKCGEYNKQDYVYCVSCGDRSENMQTLVEANKTGKSIIYTAKASKSERNKGLGGFEEKSKVFHGQSDKPSKDVKDVEARFNTQPTANNHPTVKPIKLMQYLVRLITPKGGTVLDPYIGSGSTGIGAKLEGFDFIGIEREEEYVKIAEARIAGWGQDKLIK
jgi:site-specific DNA-methyltransferase (adenine-specific)